MNVTLANTRNNCLAFDRHLNWLLLLIEQDWIHFELNTPFLSWICILSSVTRKNLQMSIKVAQNDFTRKMIDFDTFTKSFGQINCCQKV